MLYSLKYIYIYVIAIVLLFKLYIELKIYFCGSEHQLSTGTKSAKRHLIHTEKTFRNLIKSNLNSI